MYMIKNAWRSIVRAKGRNILIGIIVFVIAVSACIALSIGEAAETARSESADQLEITGQISVNRQMMMQGAESREEKRDAMTEMEELSQEQLESCAESDYVKSFYYTSSVSVDAGGELEAVDTSGMSDTDGEEANQAGAISGKMEGQEMPEETGRMGTQGAFTVTGYSSDEAMTDFLNGTSTITDGSVFDENDTTMQCIVNCELAEYNDLEVGDEITLVNPNNAEETFVFIISGIYESTDAGDSFMNMMGGFGAAFDTANRIYTSAENVAAMTDGSESLRSQLTGTYTFASVADYEAFKEETEETLGENYTVSSSDVEAYEQSLEPLENLSTYATYFLAVILGIGGIILVVLNLFTIRERKYEIGVLAAIGMKKGKIALQFMIELFCVTCIAILLGTGVGAAASVPVANQLLEQQMESMQERSDAQMKNFGREPGNMGGGSGGNMPGNGQEIPEQGMNPGDTQMSEESGGIDLPGQATAYVGQIRAATNLAVVGKLILIGIGLTLIAGCVAVVFILRYDPLRILSSRD